MKHLTIEADFLEGTGVVAMLHCEPLVRELPAPLPLPIPEKADAGHIAAMALYLTLGEDAEVDITEEGLGLLEMDLLEPATKRGVYASIDEETGMILVTSDDGSRTVELHFPLQLLV